MQIMQEFKRITTISLEQRFMDKLDYYTPKLITLMKAKGGVVGHKLRPFVDKLTQVCCVCVAFVARHVVLFCVLI